MSTQPVEADLSEFERYSIGRTKCVVARRQAELESPADREKLDAALAAEHVSAGAIQKWFRARDLRVDDKAIKLHRSGECCCV